MTRNGADNGSGARLLAFFRGEGPNHAGRTIAEILAWPDDRLERCHDYIQWLFPTRLASAYNPEAPLLNDEIARLLREDALARANIRAALDRMLAFYGLLCDDDDPDDVYVDKASDFSARARVWLQRDNHNLKRLSRMLASLAELGFRAHGEALRRCLDRIYREAGGRIGVSHAHWRIA